MQLDEPNLVVPLAASFNQRGVTGYTAVVTDEVDQIKKNSIYEAVTNALSGKTTLYLAKRPGVTEEVGDYGEATQTAYLWDVGPEGAAFTVDSSDFDGTNDYMTRGAGLTGAADGKKGIVSAWVRFDGGDGSAQQIIAGSSSVGGNVVRGFELAKDAFNRLIVRGFETGSSAVLSFSSNLNTYVASATWLHVLASWDLTDSAKRHFYVNDSSVLSVVMFTNTNIDYTLPEWSIGAIADGASKLNGCLAEVYFAPGQYLDLSVEANRRKFITASGHPANLGSDGSLPTGTAPIVYQHLDDSEAVASFATNAGTGGNFSITGTLETGSTSPTDGSGGVFSTETRWLFAVDGSDIQASDATTTTVIATAAGYAPAFVDKTKVSGADTLVVQLRNAAGTQTAWHSTAIGTFTQIADSDFTGLAHQGKMEFLDGYAFISTKSRIYNSDLNSLSAWSASGFISRGVKQDLGTGLAKLGNQIISFGTASMEVFRNVGKSFGSPLEAVPSMSQDYGLAPTIVTGMRHYYATLGNRIYWRGSNPTGVFAYNGQTVEKVSTVAVDKILAERQHYFVSQILFHGKTAISIGLTTPSAATQICLLFFPEWKDWFMWTSTVFSAVASPRLEGVVMGLVRNLYTFPTTSEVWQDNATDYEFEHTFKLPKKGHGRQRMYTFGVESDTARSALSLAVEFSDDDYQNWSTARNIDLTSHKKALYGCGSYLTPRAVRLSYTGSLGVRLENAFARIG